MLLSRLKSSNLATFCLTTSVKQSLFPRTKRDLVSEEVLFLDDYKKRSPISSLLQNLMKSCSIARVVVDGFEPNLILLFWQCNDSSSKKLIIVIHIIEQLHFKELDKSINEFRPRCNSIEIRTNISIFNGNNRQTGNYFPYRNIRM